MPSPFWVRLGNLSSNVKNYYHSEQSVPFRNQFFVIIIWQRNKFFLTCIYNIFLLIFA